MGNNDFGSFDSDDDFGFGDASGGFDSFDTEDAFGDLEGDLGDNTDNSFSNQQQNSNQFADSVSNFDSQNQNSNNEDDNRSGLMKQAVIVIAIGVVILILVFVIAGFVGKSKKNDNSNQQQQVEQQEQQEQQQLEQNTVQQKQQDTDADSIMNGDNSTDSSDTDDSNKNVITNEKDSKYTWTVITNKEDVQFNKEYSDMTFTITSIEHRARSVDTNNNLVVITNIQGSISGLSGTYELNIPYDKGVKLVVGSSFTVHVQLGTYNGKTVVGEIKY